MRLILASLFAMCLPFAAQAVVVVHYDAIEMQCRSVQRCNSKAECTADKSMKTVVSLGADSYNGSFSPFAQRREKWSRNLSYEGLDAGGAPRRSTYRTLYNVTDSALPYWKASFKERQNGWFGPELPDLNQPRRKHASTFALFHTRSLEVTGTGLFQNKERQIITFECKRAST